MKKYRQRDIVLIEVPFAEGKSSKIRPVLVISNSKLYKVNEFETIIKKLSRIFELEV